MARGPKSSLSYLPFSKERVSLTLIDSSDRIGTDVPNLFLKLKLETRRTELLFIRRCLVMSFRCHFSKLLLFSCSYPRLSLFDRHLKQQPWSALTIYHHRHHYPWWGHNSPWGGKNTLHCALELHVARSHSHGSLVPQIRVLLPLSVCLDLHLCFFVCSKADKVIKNVPLAQGCESGETSAPITLRREARIQIGEGGMMGVLSDCRWTGCTVELDVDLKNPDV